MGDSTASHSTSTFPEVLSSVRESHDPHLESKAPIDTQQSTGQGCFTTTTGSSDRSAATLNHSGSGRTDSLSSTTSTVASVFPTPYSLQPPLEKPKELQHQEEQGLVLDTKEDCTIKKEITKQQPESTPFTPRKLSFPPSTRLSLQMPARSPNNSILDPALGYSVARRPRLDFARACTSLHHSTLAEQSSPESSPLAPSAFSFLRRGLESSISSASGQNLASGFSSVSDSRAPSDDSDSTEGDGDMDFNLMLDANRNFGLLDSQNVSMSPMMPFPNRPMRVPRGRIGRHMSTSTGSSSSGFASPSPATPTTQSPGLNPSHFPTQVSGSTSRTGEDWRMSDSPSGSNESVSDEVPVGRTDPVRRAVTRRGDMRPKPKMFQRIRAELMEESCPIEVELKKEAEVTRQLHAEEDEATESSHAVKQIDYLDASAAVSGPMPVPLQKKTQLTGPFSFDAMDMGMASSPPAYPRKCLDGDVIMDSASTTPISMSPDARRAKRRRDDRFEEPINFKRRAVSPSVAGSPVLGASSPVSTNGKRLNFQGLNDTHDGLLKMSLQ